MPINGLMCSMLPRSAWALPMRPPRARYRSVSAVWIICEIGTIFRTAATIVSRLAPAIDWRAACTTIQPWHSAASRLSITSTRTAGSRSRSIRAAAVADSNAALSFAPMWMLMMSLTPAAASSS
jgi:hypothetical protein